MNRSLSEFNSRDRIDWWERQQHDHHDRIDWYIQPVALPTTAGRGTPTSASTQRHYRLHRRVPHEGRPDGMVFEWHRVTRSAHYRQKEDCRWLGIWQVGSLLSAADQLGHIAYIDH